jgi:hypothetical protein
LDFVLVVKKNVFCVGIQEERIAGLSLGRRCMIQFVSYQALHSPREKILTDMSCLVMGYVVN